MKSSTAHDQVMLARERRLSSGILRSVIAAAAANRGSCREVTVARAHTCEEEVNNRNSGPECTKIAHRHSLALLLSAASGIARNSASGSQFLFCLFRKNPRVRKIVVRNSGAGNGCVKFMGAWKNCVLSAGKPLSIKFLVLGGGGGFGVLGGGSADLIFMGAGIFLTSVFIAEKIAVR